MRIAPHKVCLILFALFATALALSGCAMPEQARETFRLTASTIGDNGEPIQAEVLRERVGYFAPNYGEHETTATLRVASDGTVTVAGGEQKTKSAVSAFFSGLFGFFTGLFI